MKYHYYPGCSLEGPALEYNLSTRAVMTSLGAELMEIQDWTCCGALHINAKVNVKLEAVASIFQGAKGADAIVTVCPMCQMKLEAYQQKISRRHKEDAHMTILYLPQFIGLALGLSEQELRIDLNLSITDGFREKLENV